MADRCKRIVGPRVDVQVTAEHDARVRVGRLQERHDGRVVLGLLGAVGDTAIGPALEVVVDHIDIGEDAGADALAPDAEQADIGRAREDPGGLAGAYAGSASTAFNVFGLETSPS